MSESWLPPQALERLARQKASSGAWTSDLSVGELAAIRSVGFEAAGQVMGSSVYQLGWAANAQRCPFGGFGSWELTAYSAALIEARVLALDRMRQEAAVLGAHGVAGVRLNLRAFEGQVNVIEFTAIGTAIRRAGVEPLPRPFLSNLSGQDFAKLLHSGHAPAGLVMGLSVIHVHTGWGAQWNLSSWYNSEIGDFSLAVSEARHRALGRLRQDVAAHGADGAVGSEVGLNVWRTTCSNNTDVEDHVVQFFILGTAVSGFDVPAESGSPKPSMALTVDDLRRRSSAMDRIDG